MEKSFALYHRIKSPCLSPSYFLTVTAYSVFCLLLSIVVLEKEPPGASGWPNRAKRTVISFPEGDPENPYNWSTLRKVFIAATVVSSGFNSTFNSAVTSGIIDALAVRYRVKSDAQLVLPISMYLLGYVFGPLVFGPLSESYGRRLLMNVTFLVFICFTIACAVAPNWPSFLVFRFLQGVGASAPLAVVGGIYADIFNNPTSRGRAMACFMAATVFGPVVAPIASGFAVALGWQWAFWISLMISAVSLPAIITVPETYGPIILKKRAKRFRKEKGNPNIFAPMELGKKGARQLITVVLTRPIRMFFFEAIVFFSCLYTAFCFGVFYLFFSAYPIIFEGIYGLGKGGSGLAFLPIGIGAILAVCTFVAYDKYLAKAQRAGKPWASREEYRRLPLACIAGPAWVVSLFWLAWTADPSIHWIVPMLSGIPCGFGYMLNWMAILNYITDAYEIFSASALAANATTRSIFGFALPFAAKPMYDRLGVHWASSLLGFVSLLLATIPYVFVYYGPTIRSHSKFCQALAQAKEEAFENARTARDEEKKEKEEEDCQASASTSGTLEEKV